MWICNRCQSRNRDGDRHCIECAAPRNARRFGASTPVEAPSLAREALPERRPAAVTDTVPLQPSLREEHYSVPRRGRLFGGVLTAFGSILLVLLPALLIYLAVHHQATLAPQVQGLVNPSGSQDTSLLVYWGLTALAALLCAVPGMLLTAAAFLVRGRAQRV
jgi:hypothetical protein